MSVCLSVCVIFCEVFLYIISCLYVFLFHAQELSFSLGGAAAVAADTIGIESLVPFPLNKLSLSLLFSSLFSSPPSASKTSARRAASVWLASRVEPCP